MNPVSTQTPSWKIQFYISIRSFFTNRQNKADKRLTKSWPIFNLGCLITTTVEFFAYFSGQTSQGQLGIVLLLWSLRSKTFLPRGGGEGGGGGRGGGGGS